MQAWPFVHPEFAAAGAAVGVLPILIHLLNRRRYKFVRWGAMAFLRGALKRSARRLRIEQWALLLVRVAVLATLFLAVARPYFPFSARGGWWAPGGARMHRIVVIDTSCSMRASAGRSGGGTSARTEVRGSGSARHTRATRFTQAMELVDALLATFPAGDAVSLVTTAAPAQAVVGYAAYDRRRVREALFGVHVSHRGTDLAGALATALSIVDDARSQFGPGDHVRVYVVSDLGGKAAWSDGAIQGAREVAHRVHPGGLVLVPVGDAETANVAVTDVRLERGWPGLFCADDGGGRSGGAMPLRVEAAVSNYSSRAKRGLQLQVSVGDRIVRRVGLERIGAFQTYTARFSIAADRIGARCVKVAVEGAAGDALPLDNSRRAAVELREGIDVLAVEGRSGRGLGGDAGYLSTALAPGSMQKTRPTRGGAAFGESRAASGIRVRTIHARDLSRELGGDGAPPTGRGRVGYGMVALCNVARLDEGDWELLTRFVRAGGGLLVCGGDLINPKHYSRYGYAEGRGVLPCRVDGVSHPLPAGAPALRFAADALTHSLLADFSEHTDSGLFLARIQHHLRVRPDPKRSEVLLRYTNGDPAMVGRVLGAGRVILWTTSADMSWTNLPAKGDYVSLMANVAGYLARLKGAQRTLTVGDSIEERLNAVESTMPLRVTGPGGQVQDARPTVAGGAFALEHGPLERPGTYDLSIGSRSATYAVNVDPSESDLRVPDRETLERTLRCPFTLVEHPTASNLLAARAKTSEIGGSLLYVVLALIVIESWLAMRFGGRRS